MNADDIAKARATIAASPPTKEWDCDAYDRGDTTEEDGYESSDYVDGWNDAIAASQPWIAGLPAALDEVERLTGLINTPRTDEFFDAVRIEAAHQIGRWGIEHDAGKRSEDWVTLLIYLPGKAARAHYDGDTSKLEHHVITTAAVALNWWRHLVGVHKVGS